MTTLTDDAELVLNLEADSFRRGEAAFRLAKAILRAASDSVRTVSENCQRLAIVDAEHYEALLLRAAGQSGCNGGNGSPHESTSLACGGGGVSDGFLARSAGNC